MLDKELPPPIDPKVLEEIVKAKLAKLRQEKIRLRTILLNDEDGPYWDSMD